MGKRIKLIYILSLFSALMAISVQAYWLYNQYRYEVERYADEIAADVLRVGDEEFAERRKMAIGDDTSYIIDRSSRTQSGTSTIRNVQTQLCFDFKTDVLFSDSAAFIHSKKPFDFSCSQIYPQKDKLST